MKRLISLTVVVAVMVLAWTGLAQGRNSPSPAVPVDDYTEGIGEPQPRTSGGMERSGDAQISARGPRSTSLPTGFGDTLLTSSDAGVRNAVFSEAIGAGADVVRLFVSWRQVAPSSRGVGFVPTNPASPGYDWSRIDAAVKAATANGLRPLLLVTEAPSWAEGANRDPSAAAGTWKPIPTDVADFGTAIAKRYSGGFLGLPQVRDFMLWNEPNLESNLTPVWTGKGGTDPAAPAQYVRMLNAFYSAVKDVDNRNQIITGGTAPYGADPGVLNMRPLTFWNEVLCVKNSGKAKKCKNRPKFDVLAHHPINTSGGPRTSAISPLDISTPDVHNLIDSLRAAEKAGNVADKGKHDVWATEIWWQSNPPDPSGVSLKRQAEYYAEALYVLWKQGVSMVLPYQVRDDNYDGTPGRTSFETGAYTVSGEPKPAARALAFPFVAERTSKSKVLLWGKAPKSGKLVIRTAKGKKIGTTKVKGNRVFTAKARLRGSEKLTATVGGAQSLSWKVK